MNWRRDFFITWDIRYYFKHFSASFSSHRIAKGPYKTTRNWPQLRCITALHPPAQKLRCYSYSIAVSLSYEILVHFKWFGDLRQKAIDISAPHSDAMLSIWTDHVWTFTKLITKEETKNWNLYVINDPWDMLRNPCRKWFMINIRCFRDDVMRSMQ